MTAELWAALWLEFLRDIPSILTFVGIIITMRISLGNRALGLRTHAEAVETKELAKSTERNTNSALSTVNAALVASTALASNLRGREDARVEGEIKAADMAKGAAAAKDAINEAKKPE